MTAEEIAGHVRDVGGDAIIPIAAADPEALHAAVAAELGDGWLVGLMVRPEGPALDVRRWSAEHMALLAPTLARK